MQNQNKRLPNNLRRGPTPFTSAPSNFCYSLALMTSFTFIVTALPWETTFNCLSAIIP